jgi:hypothetical protein
MKWTGLLPFEILYGHPSPLIKGIKGDLKEIGDLTLRQQMQALRVTLSKINDWDQERLLTSLTTPTHLYRPRDVWVKEWNVQPIKTHWGSPFVVYFVYHYCS